MCLSESVNVHEAYGACHQKKVALENVMCEKI